jgi:hypothetical protein
MVQEPTEFAAIHPPVLRNLAANMGETNKCGVSAEHFWLHLGPGPARKVVAQLLNDSKYDHLISASDTSPDGIRSVSITPRTEVPTSQGTKGASSVAAEIRNANQGGRTFSRGLADLRATDSTSTDHEANTPPLTVSTLASSATPALAPAPADNAAAVSADPNAAPSPANAANAGNSSTNPSTAADNSQPAANSSSNSAQSGNLTDRMMQMLQNMYAESKQQMRQAQQKSSAQN